MKSLLQSWLSTAQISIMGDDGRLSLDRLSLKSATTKSDLLSLPAEIVESIFARLDFQSLKYLRSSSKKLGDSTSPLLFGTLRIRFRHRDLTSVLEIARSDHLRQYVHTLLYVGDQYIGQNSFSNWKNAVGIVDRLPTPAHFQPHPAEPPPWTLEHAQWRGYRRFQQIMKEQEKLRKDRIEHLVFLEALPRFFNVKHFYVLTQQEDLRMQSHSKAIKETMYDWKPSSDTYRQWGASRPPPQRTRLQFLQVLQWLSSGAHSDTVRTGLESLVICGLDWGHMEPDFDVTGAPASLLISLKHVTLDFRKRNGSTHSTYHFDWVKTALMHFVNSAIALETLNVYHSCSQPKLKLHLAEILGSNTKHSNLKQVTLSLFTFDEQELLGFVRDHKCSLQKLVIEKSDFLHKTAWKEWVLSETDCTRPKPSGEELVKYFVDSWADNEEQRIALTEAWRENPDPEALADIEARFNQRPRKDDISVQWPEDSAFAGSFATYNEANDTLKVEWPENQES